MNPLSLLNYAKGKVLAIEIIGTVFIILLGSAFHFTFELSNNNPIVGSFSAVNESVWEHLKLVFWPSLIWMLIALYPVRGLVNNYFFSKAIGVYIMVIFIPIVFYTYTAFIEESLFVDIGSFVAAIIIGQFVSYRLYRYKISKAVEIISIATMVLLAIIFVIFTFYPPHLHIFQDLSTGQYGIT
jgi:hypothetical protein